MIECLSRRGPLPLTAEDKAIFKGDLAGTANYMKVCDRSDAELMFALVDTSYSAAQKKTETNRRDRRGDGPF